MGKEIITFGNTEVENINFTNTKALHKSPISSGDINIYKTLVSNKVPFGKKGFKYFVGYKDNGKVKPFCIMLPKMSAYRRDFDEPKYVSILVR